MRFAEAVQHLRSHADWFGIDVDGALLRAGVPSETVAQGLTGSVARAAIEAGIPKRGRDTHDESAPIRSIDTS
ncbi:hypothetical protein OH809_21015 [Streptomyces sp. NBC_00873]|uniref:hypothetical protein n=1 Tax=unclassified Streptomyces TaxID=2593676 RepID=UPI00386E9E29|nr:hypothetical protein OH809_21015 [Streptomyces sp. NBC_00873]WTA45070.1 hypothetical protein OH821_22585 [Streptomyces sp. NBC_00842]